jgi:hypothetical protein
MTNLPEWEIKIKNGDAGYEIDIRVVFSRIAAEALILNHYFSLPA